MVPGRGRTDRMKVSPLLVTPDLRRRSLSGAAMILDLEGGDARLHFAKHQSASCGEPLRKPLDTIQPLLNVRHARRVTDAQIIIRSERDARHRRDLLLIQQARAKVG